MFRPQLRARHVRSPAGSARLRGRRCDGGQQPTGIRKAASVSGPIQWASLGAGSGPCCCRSGVAAACWPWADHRRDCPTSRVQATSRTPLPCVQNVLITELLDNCLASSQENRRLPCHARFFFSSRICVVTRASTTARRVAASTPRLGGSGTCTCPGPGARCGAAEGEVGSALLSDPDSGAGRLADEPAAGAVAWRDPVERSAVDPTMPEAARLPASADAASNPLTAVFAPTATTLAFAATAGLSDVKCLPHASPTRSGAGAW